MSGASQSHRKLLTEEDEDEVTALNYLECDSSQVDIINAAINTAIEGYQGYLGYWILGYLCICFYHHITMFRSHTL